MFMIAAVKTQSLLDEAEQLGVVSRKNRKQATGGGCDRGLKRTTLVAADECTISILRKNTGEGLHFMKRWELGSKPRGRQEIQNWLSTPANSAVGTVITTASCQIKPTQIHAAMQQKKYT